MIMKLAENWAEEMRADCEKATHSILISSLSLAPPRHPSQTPFGRLWQSWADAAARNVQVTFFLASPTKVHPATAQNATAGALAFKAGIRVRFVPQPNLLHAKSAVIDEHIVWIGSGNMTAAAAHHNHEIYIRVESQNIAHRIATRWDKIANPA